MAKEVRDNIKGSSFVPELAVIVEYIASKNCYRACPFNTTIDLEDTIYLQPIGGVAPLNHDMNDSSGTLGMPLKHPTESAQVTPIYAPKTTVMALISKALPSESSDYRVGYIIGKVSDDIYSRFHTKPIENVAPLQDFDTIDVFKVPNDKNQTVPLISTPDNITNDIIPGDYVQRSKQAYTLLDDISYTVGTDLTRTWHSAVTGEITNNCMLQQNYSVYSDSTSYIINESILKLDKYSGNPYDAGLDTVSITTTGLEAKTKPKYSYVEAFGDIIDGNYRTRYTKKDPSKKAVETTFIPTWQEHIDMSGAYRLNSTKSIHIGLVPTHENEDSPSFTAIDCTGTHFKPSMDSTVKLQPQMLPEFEASSAVAPQEWEKSANNIVKQSGVFFEEDGSVLIRDAWGSYILMKGGNIQIHSENNTFITSNRDILVFSGGVESHVAPQGFQLESVNGDIIINTGAKVKFNSSDLHINSTYLRVDNKAQVLFNSPVITIGKETTTWLTIGSSKAPAIIDSYTAQYTLIGSSIVVGTDSGLFNFSNNACELTASVRVGGNIIVGDTKYSVKLDNDTRQYKGSGGSLYLCSGGITAAYGITSTTGSIVAPYIIGETCASKSGIMAKVTNFSLDSNKTALAHTAQTSTRNISIRTSKIADSLVKLTDSKEYISQSCCYRAEPYEVMNGVAISVGAIDGYLYPGEPFWVSNGIQTYSIKTENKNGITVKTKIDKVQGFNTYNYHVSNLKK